MSELNKFNEEDYINKEYGNYIILSFEFFNNYKKSRQPFYKVKCKNCDNIYTIGLWTLRSNIDSDCKYCRGKKQSLPNSQSLTNALYSSYKRQAKNRDYSFEITKEDFIKIINQNCFYCGEIPSNIIKSRSNIENVIYNGIDRLDNKLGYIKSNIVACCGMCNRCKSNLTLSEWYKWINKIIKYNKDEFCE